MGEYRQNPESSGGCGDSLPISHESLLQFPTDPIACMKRLQAEFGDLAVMEDDGKRLVFVFSPDLNRQVLTDTETFHSRFFAVRGGRHSAQRRVTSGLLSQNGTNHRESRRAMMDVFTKRMLPQFHETITNLTCEMMESWQKGDVQDLNDEMVRLMLRLTSALLFGIDDVAYSVELGEKIDRWVRWNHEVGMGAMVSSSRFSDGYESLLEMAEDLEVSVGEMLQRHRHGNDRRVNILSLLLQAQAADSGMTDDQLVGHVTLLFAAAHLTTAHTLTWTLLLLAQHPQVMEMVRAEMDRDDGSLTPDHSTIESLTYLDQVIRESMRVLPASSYSQRVCVKATRLGPLNLPPMTPVIFSQYITHHRPDLYPDPSRFQPERWDAITPSSYEYLPFGAGSRRCIGAPLAMVELRTALTVMLKKFHFELLPGSIVDGQVVSTMLGPTTTVPARLLSTKEIPSAVPVAGTIRDLVKLPPAPFSGSQRKAA
ncbi:MAG: cytochrome P450 [Fuerstiella sp.]|nr:cytochrome P450 [Fuerstiella sp.]